jgi:arylsulfatase A-like enzyme
MNRRGFLAQTAGGVFAAASSVARAQQGAGERPPNIVFFLFDKCRRDAVGAYGLRDVHTPNLDFLAQTGVRFDACYAPQALCGPARASVLTGSYPHAHGLRRNVYEAHPGPSNSTDQEVIPDPFRDTRFKLWDNFPHLLNAGGFATGHIGKWHLGPANPGFFDYWKGFNSVLLHWIGEPHNSVYRPDVHTDKGIRFIERHADEPFFLYQSYYSPHEPNDPPKRFLEHYEGQEHAEYYASVTALDWNVGRMLDTLRKLNLLDNTLIIFSTEHGRSWTQRPGTLEGMCTAYDESARIPLILRYPKRLPQGKVWNSGVSLVDLMPTILDIAGVAPQYSMDREPLPQIQGRNLVPLITGGTDRWDQPVVIENIPQLAIEGSLYDERAIRNERYKLILRKFDSRPVFRPGELYDLQDDRGETNNLYASRTEIAKGLAAELSAWGTRYDDRLSIELGNYAAGKAH